MDVRRRFVLRMLALVPVDATITGIFIGVSGRPGVLITDIALNVSIFGVLNALLALWLFRPISAFLKGGGNEAAALSRTQHLAVLAASQASVLALLYCVGAGYFGVFTPDAAAIDALSTHYKLAATAWYSFIYAAFYGFAIFFLINDFVGCLKQRLAISGLVVPPAGHRIIYKLLCVFLIVAVLPNILIVLDLTVFKEFRAAQGLSVVQTIFLDLLASAFLVAVSFIFVTRNLTMPIDRLMGGVNRVRRGEFATSVENTADDELGELTGAFNSMIGGLRERAYIRETFGRFVPERVAAALLDNGGDLAPRAATATILFTDIEGFTTIAETAEPERVVQMLNEYFSAVTEPIGRFGGTVNQFQGDAMLVTFNIPVADLEHADNAVGAALAIQAATRDRLFAGIRLRTRAGINTGEVVAGPVGSGDRLSYTVHGNAVNVAARLEQMNKELGTSVLISETTARQLNGTYPLLEMGALPVRGVSETVHVYRIDDPA